MTFLHSFEPGGVERIALRLVRHWRAQGVDAPLFMGRPAGAMRAELGQDLDYIMPRQPRFDTGWFETFWMIATLPGVIRRCRPDVLFCAGNSYTVVAVAMKLLLGKDCPPVVAKISNDLDRADMILLVRMVYRIWLRIQGHFIDRFVGMERPMAQEIAEAVGVDAADVTIIPDPALSVAMIARMRVSVERSCGSGRRFVGIGRLAPQKNFALMIRSFAQGRAAHDHLTLFGEGPERRRLEALIAELGLEQAVTLAGHVADPAAALSRFDIFLLSSDYEGVPAVVLEALVAGVTIVATRCSRSMAMLLHDGALGRLVAVRDEAAFAQAIVQARPDSQNRALSLEQAERFTIERAASAYLRCFRDTCETISAFDWGADAGPPSEPEMQLSKSDL